MRDSTLHARSPPRSPVHEALDVALLALASAHRRLAAAPADFIERSGLMTPALADLGRWHDAQLRFGYGTLIAANRCAGALALAALGEPRPAVPLTPSRRSPPGREGKVKEPR
jgi:hypothetical protein